MNRTRQAVSPRGGFTLVELIVVLAIVAVLVSISVPAIASLVSPKETLRKQGRRVMKLMHEARAAAMERKVRVEIWIDPLHNGIFAVEAQPYRALLTADPLDRPEHGSEEWNLAMTNRFAKRIVFGEEITLEGFPVEAIAPPATEEDFFQRADPFEQDDDGGSDPEAPILALAFTHFGGSDGGGVSLYYRERRLDLAADLLTGRPRPVVRREVAE